MGRWGGVGGEGADLRSHLAHCQQGLRALHHASRPGAPAATRCGRLQPADPSAMRLPPVPPLAAPAIQAMPVTSQICEPAVGAVIDDDEVTGEPQLAGLRLLEGWDGAPLAVTRHPSLAGPAPPPPRLAPAPWPSAPLRRSQGVRLERRRAGHHPGGRLCRRRQDVAHRGAAKGAAEAR